MLKCAIVRGSTWAVRTQDAAACASFLTVQCSAQHYIPSLLAVKGLEEETDCSGSITYVHWWGDGEHMQPETFNLWEVSGDLVEQMR